MRGPFPAALAVVVFLSMIFTPMIDQADGSEEVFQPVEPRPPSISMSLYSDEIEMDTGPGSFGHEEGNGTITVEKPKEARAETVVINLYFRSNNEEIMGSVYPELLEVQAGILMETWEFRVNLEINPMISSINIDTTFEIYGEWSYRYYDSSGSISPVQGRVILNPFYYFTGTVVNQEELMDVPIGSWRTAELKVTNEGNCRVIITLDEVSTNQTLDCEIERSSVTLNEGESEIVNVRLRKKSGPVKPTGYEQIIKLEARVEGRGVISYYAGIYIETVYTPGSFFKSIWFKLSIVGVILLAVLITVFTIRKKRKNRKTQELTFEQI